MPCLSVMLAVFLYDSRDNDVPTITWYFLTTKIQKITK